MTNRLVSVDDNNNLPPAVQAQLVGRVEAHFSDLTSQATTAAATATGAAQSAGVDAASANASRVAASAAAAQATAPTDSMVASLVSSDASETSAALGGKFSTVAATTAGLAAKRSVLPGTLLSDVSFNSVTTSGVYVVAGNPSDITAPVATPGILSVEASGSLVQQTYSGATTYTRSASGGVWTPWRVSVNSLGARPRGKVAFIGDSYTYGAQLTDLSKRWATLLSATLGVTEQNLANSGSGYLNTGASGNFVTQSLSVAPDAQTVIICGGINDAPMSPTQEQLNTAMTSIVNNVRGKSPSARIIIISPMWYHLNPSAGLLQVDARLRIAAAALGVRYVEGGPWLRFDRADWSFGDGHPNDAGHAVIAAWVEDQLADAPRAGAAYGAFLRPGTSDATFSGPAPTALAEGTIITARRGWWRIRGTAVLYGSVIGFLWIKTGSYTSQVRHDVIGGASSPQPLQREVRIYHPGGDMLISVGYTPNASSSTSVLSNGQTGVWAEWVGY